MTPDSIYRNIPKVLTGLFLALAFYFLARTLNGYPQDQQHLIVLSDLVLSVGLFAVATPASLLLSDEVFVDASKSKLKYFAVALTGIVLVLSLLMVFSNSIEGYFGFEYAPEKSSVVFLALLLSSILISFVFLFDSLRGLKSRQALMRWPLVFHFAACGIGLSLVFLLGMQSLDSEIQADATIVLSEFLRRLVLVGAVSQILMTLIKGHSTSSKLYSAVSLMGAVLFLIGFQSSTLRTGGSELLYVFNQAAQLAGLGLIMVVTVNILVNAWKKKTTDLLNQGQWVGHGAFIIGLLMTIISSGPFGFLALSGITQSFQMLILAVVAPLLIQKASQQSQTNPSQASHFANALNWSGLFVCFIYILIMSPFGGSLVVSQNSAFKPMLGIMMSGMFLLLLSYLVSVWDRILHDWILVR
jgi:hypothetical protein